MVALEVEGKKYTPQEISARILMKLKKDAEDYEIKSEAIKVQKQKLYIKLLEDQAPVNIDEKKLRVMVDAQNTYYNIGWVSITLGFVFIFIGFWSWYFKIQRHLDKNIASD